MQKRNMSRVNDSNRFISEFINRLTTEPSPESFQ